MGPTDNNQNGPGALEIGGSVKITTLVYREKGTLPEKRGGGRVLMLQNYPLP